MITVDRYAPDMAPACRCSPGASPHAAAYCLVVSTRANQHRVVSVCARELPAAVDKLKAWEQGESKEGERT